jgi:hypothetical protein
VRAASQGRQRDPTRSPFRAIAPIGFSAPHARQIFVAGEPQPPRRAHDALALVVGTYGVD